jgi:hypothetical protein
MPLLQRIDLDTIFPDQTLSTVKVRGKETGPFAGNRKVTAVATCAGPPSGLEWKVLSSANNSIEPGDPATTAVDRTAIAAYEEDGTVATYASRAHVIFANR